MRTTLTIEDTLVGELKNLAHETGKPFKQVVNETLLVGLQQKTVRKTKSATYRLNRFHLTHRWQVLIWTRPCI